MLNIIIITAKILLTVVSGTILCVLFFYCQSNIYSFPKTKKFSGNEFYNPYADISENTINANFHAHTSAYGGVTNGDNSLQEMKDAYRKRNIDLPGISNYFSTTPTDEIRIYEHGINISKTHKLAINPKDELYFDYAFYQNTSQKQDIISRLKEKDALVVIAHPNMRNGHNTMDMTQMVGYDFTEIRSYYANAEKYWDAALQTGKLSWLMANDDSHGVKKQLPGRFYNVVFANNSKEVLNEMQKGKHYAIAQKEDTTDLALNYLTLQESSIQFDLGNNATKTTLVADGVTVDSVSGGKGTFAFPKYASYIRLVGESENCHLYTNPVTRQSKAQIFNSVSFLTPTIKPFQTILARTFASMAFLSLLLATVRMWLKINLPFKNIRLRIPAVRI